MEIGRKGVKKEGRVGRKEGGKNDTIAIIYFSKVVN